MKLTNHVFVYTGQYYDYEMSKIFFEDLELPEPDIYPGIGSGTHAEPTTKAAETVTIKPGVHADFDRGEKLIGMEVIDSSEIIGGEIEFKLPEVVHSTTKL